MEKLRWRFKASREFQPFPGYRDITQTPGVVARQTDTIIQLIRQGILPNLEPAQDYLHDCTIPWLTKAEEGSEMIYQKGDITRKPTKVDLETREAAGFAFVIFAWMRHIFPPPNLVTVFSRYGLLQPPQDQDEYLDRVKEIKINLWRISHKEVPSLTYRFPTYDPSLLRTLAFFEVGSKLPVKLTGNQKIEKEEEKKRFDQLLGNLPVDLGTD